MKTELTAVVKILDAIYRGSIDHIFTTEELKTMVSGLGLQLSALIVQADDINASIEIYELIEEAEHLDDLVKEKLGV